MPDMKDRSRFGRSALAGLLFLTAAAGPIACERKPGTGGDTNSTGDIVVGMYGSLTGDGASFGQSSREGTVLAVDEINHAGGLLGGRRIRLLVEDDQSKPDEASNAVTKLVTQDKAVAVLGEVASRRSLAAAPVCQKYMVPMISPSSTNERVTQVGDYIFRVCFIDPFQGEVLAKFAYNNLKARKVAILKDIQQDYSVGFTGSIVKHFTALGGQVLDPVSYSSGDSDFKAILTQVRSQKPDAITRSNSTDGPKLREALSKADVPGVTGRLKITAKRDVDKPAVIQEVTFANGEVKFVYKTTINPN